MRLSLTTARRLLLIDGGLLLVSALTAAVGHSPTPALADDPPPCVGVTVHVTEPPPGVDVCPPDTTTTIPDTTLPPTTLP